MRTKSLIFLLVLSLLVVGMTACNLNNNRPLTKGYNTPDGLAPYTYNNDNRNGMNNNPYDNRYGYMYNNGPSNNIPNNNVPNTNVPNNPRVNQFQTNANADADKMANSASSVSGVKDATVVISGGTAYVGLNLENKVPSAQSASIEDKVYKKLSQYKDKYNINITSDATIFGRLRDIGNGIRSGTPATNYQNDLRSFNNRLRSFPSYP